MIGGMNSTSLSILERARSRDGESAWRAFAAIYSPLLRTWIARYEVAENDADDLVQEVLLFVGEHLPDFEHNGRTGAFRNWLRQALVYRLRKFWNDRRRRPAGYGTGDSRAVDLLNELEDPKSSQSQLWNREHDRHVLSQLMSQLRSEFAGTTWEAFRLTAIEGEKASDVTEKLGMTANAVWVAKSRVMRRLRQLSEGLVDSK